MTPALFAVLPLTYRRFLKHANMLSPSRDLHGIWLPEAEGIYRSA
jgi:hypothetical protein